MIRKSLVWYFNLSFSIYYWPWLVAFLWRLSLVEAFSSAYWWTCGLALPILAAAQGLHYGGWLLFGWPAYKEESRLGRR